MEMLEYILMTNSARIKIFCDGGSRGNPGPAASGVVFLSQNDEVLHEFSQYLGETTNNQAEYRAVLLAINKMHELAYHEADFYLDSELVTKQLNGEYRIKNLELKPVYDQIKQLSQDLQITFTHVRREFNKLADAQVNICLDQHSTKPKKIV